MKHPKCDQSFPCQIWKWIWHTFVNWFCSRPWTNWRDPSRSSVYLDPNVKTFPWMARIQQHYRRYLRFCPKRYWSKIAERVWWKNAILHFPPASPHYLHLQSHSNWVSCSKWSIGMGSSIWLFVLTVSHLCRWFYLLRLAPHNTCLVLSGGAEYDATSLPYRCN